MAGFGSFARILTLTAALGLAGLVLLPPGAAAVTRPRRARGRAGT